LHPDNFNKNYEVIPVPFMDAEMESLMNYRRDSLTKIKLD